MPVNHATASADASGSGVNATASADAANDHATASRAQGAAGDDTNVVNTELQGRPVSFVLPPVEPEPEVHEDDPERSRRKRVRRRIRKPRDMSANAEARWYAGRKERKRMRPASPQSRSRSLLVPNALRPPIKRRKANADLRSRWATEDFRNPLNAIRSDQGRSSGSGMYLRSQKVEE